jgi:hypothetical protein
VHVKGQPRQGARLVVKDCVFEANYAAEGGGVYLSGASTGKPGTPQRLREDKRPICFASCKLP